MKSAVMLLTIAVAVGASTGSSATAWQNERPSSGYLTHDRIADLASKVPAAPTSGSPAEVADRAASARLAALEETDRGLLATRQAERRPGVALAHFDGALGFRVVPGDSPRLVAILTRVLHDANEAAELAKARVMRSRPVGDDPDRRSCQVVTPAQRATASHPSGSASVGTAYGVVMAALVPDRADAVMETGRQIAVSRMICGMHYPADVADGAALGRAVGREIVAAPGFQTDATAAREEIAAARAAAQASPSCAAERAALAIPIP